MLQIEIPLISPLKMKPLMTRILNARFFARMPQSHLLNWRSSGHSYSPKYPWFPLPSLTSFIVHGPNAARPHSSASSTDVGPPASPSLSGTALYPSAPLSSSLRKKPPNANTFHSESTCLVVLHIVVSNLCPTSYSLILMVFVDQFSIQTLENLPLVVAKVVLSTLIVLPI